MSSVNDNNDTTDVVVNEEAESNNRGNFTRNMSKETDASIAKKMFLGGLCGLPWLWAVNAYYFRQQLRDPSVDAGVTRCTFNNEYSLSCM